MDLSPPLGFEGEGTAEVEKGGIRGCTKVVTKWWHTLRS
jgi:hypothetical protein